jgi:hypothetical protein
MSKKPMTWLGLIKMKLSEEKAKGKAPSIGDVTPTAKKEWVQIKEGKHPLYIQGKAQTFARKKKGETKTKKNKGSRSSSPGSSGSSGSPVDIQQIMNEAKLCNKCKKKAEKVMKKKGMSGGDVAKNAGEVPSTQTGGTCTACMAGGNCGGSCDRPL